MAKNHVIYLFTVQPAEDFNNSQAPTFPENVEIISLHDSKPYHSIFNRFPAKIADAINYRMLLRRFFTSTDSYFLKAYSLLTKKLTEVQPGIVYFENLEAVNLFSLIVKKKYHLPDYYMMRIT